MPTFEYVHQIIRAQVRGRKKEKGSDKYQGAYITVPGEWLDKKVKVHQEDNPKEKLDRDVRGSPPRFTYVNLPVAWIDKTVVAELKED